MYADAPRASPADASEELLGGGALLVGARECRGGLRLGACRIGPTGADQGGGQAHAVGALHRLERRRV